VVWGALAEWNRDFASTALGGVGGIALGLWSVGRWVWAGLLPRWVAAFCCGGVIGVMILGSALSATRPHPDPAEEARWQAEFGWYAPAGFVVGGLVWAAGVLLYLPAVGRFLAYQRFATLGEAGRAPGPPEENTG